MVFGPLDTVTPAFKKGLGHRFQYNFVDEFVLKTAEAGANLYCITEGQVEGKHTKRYGKYNPNTHDWETAREVRE